MAFQDADSRTLGGTRGVYRARRATHKRSGGYPGTRSERRAQANAAVGRCGAFGREGAAC